MNQLTGQIPATLCGFANSINPQQGGVNLLCASPLRPGFLDARLVPGDGTLEVRWAAPSDGGVIDGYDVRYRTAAESGAAGAWTELAGAAGSEATSATIIGLSNGTSYEVQVRASGASGPGEWSAGVIGAPAVPAAAPDPGEELSFGDARIEDQRFRQYEAITALALPAATGGTGSVTYALSPAPPAGLAFDAGARTLHGAPSAASRPVTYTYTATDAAAATASLTFTIEVEMSAEEAALRRDALAAQGRALLSSVTGVIGERLRPRSGPPDSRETESSARALDQALVALLGLRTGRGFGLAAGGAEFSPGVGSAGRAAGFGGGRYGVTAPGSAGGAGGRSGPGSDSGLGGLSGLGSTGAPGGRAGFGRFGGAGGRDLAALGRDGLGGSLPAFGREASGFGGGVWGGLSGQSFSAPVPVGAGGGESSRYTVWGAGDVQSFSGSPEAGRYSGDVRSLYVGADGRLGFGLAGGGGGEPELGFGGLHGGGGGGASGPADDGADERLPLRAGRGDAEPGGVGHRGLRTGFRGRRAGRRGGGHPGRYAGRLVDAGRLVGARRPADGDGCGRRSAGRG